MGSGVCDGKGEDVGMGVYVGYGVPVGTVVGAVVGSACSQARNAMVMPRLSSMATTRDAVLDGVVVEIGIRVKIRKTLGNTVRIDGESIA